MKKLLAVALSALLLSGCATIVGSDNQLVQVDSKPQGAAYIIKDKSGKVISQGVTPSGVTLAKSDGSYFGKKEYDISFTKDGFKPVTLPVKSSPNGWYIGGNIVFGGLIGWLAVDPFNGKMYTLKPKDVSADMLADTK